jgi:uncharacterized membrane protein YkoI
MKKKVLAAIGALTVAGVIGFVYSESGVVKAEPSLSQDDIRKKVMEQYPGEITELELEKKGNREIYEVEIKLEGKEYELKMDGDTGEVLKLEGKVPTKDDGQSSVKVEGAEKDSKPNSNVADQNKQPVNKENDSKKTSPSTKTVISTEEAKKIALSNFAGDIKELELDEDDNRLIYEIEIVNGNRKAEIEVDAYTGAVLVLEIETDDDDNDDND